MRPNGTPVKVRDEEVLAVAADVFYDRGYVSASVQAIADALGILKGSLYYYIDSKEDLLFRLLSKVYTDLDDIMTAVKAREDLGSLERLHEYVRLQVEYFAANIKQVSIYVRDRQYLSEAHQSVMTDRREAQAALVVGLIDRARAEGRISTTTRSEILSHLVFGSFIWTHWWYKPELKISGEQLAIDSADFVIRALTGTVPFEPAV
jgi:AcrR family transcriptional regulator